MVFVFLLVLSSVDCSIFMLIFQWRRKMEKIELNTLAFLHLLAASTPFAHLSNFVFLFKSQLSYILWNITWLTLSWSDTNTPSPHSTVQYTFRFTTILTIHGEPVDAHAWSLESCKGHIKIFLMVLFWGLRYYIKNPWMQSRFLEMSYLTSELLFSGIQHWYSVNNH